LSEALLLIVVPLMVVGWILQTRSLERRLM